ncbi:hypothetical protein SMICM304S_10833 [Streptomyces microflavus]
MAAQRPSAHPGVSVCRPTPLVEDWTNWGTPAARAASIRLVACASSPAKSTPVSSIGGICTENTARTSAQAGSSEDRSARSPVTSSTPRASTAFARGECGSRTSARTGTSRPVLGRQPRPGVRWHR